MKPNRYFPAVSLVQIDRLLKNVFCIMDPLAIHRHRRSVWSEFNSSIASDEATVGVLDGNTAAVVQVTPTLVTKDVQYIPKRRSFELLCKGNLIWKSRFVIFNLILQVRIDLAHTVRWSNRPTGSLFGSVEENCLAQGNNGNGWRLRELFLHWSFGYQNSCISIASQKKLALLINKLPPLISTQALISHLRTVMTPCELMLAHLFQLRCLALPKTG